MNWRLLLWKILKRRGTSVIRSITASIYKYLRRRDRPASYRPYGVSAVVWSKNEEDWIALSMRSVAEIVNEYVLIDSSTDRTPEIAVEVVQAPSSGFLGGMREPPPAKAGGFCGHKRVRWTQTCQEPFLWYSDI